jgi:hypothetical protein
MTYIPNPAFVPATQSNRSEEIDPISQHFVSATLVDITNGTDGTYYYYVDMNSFKHLGAQWTISGGSGTCTMTIEGTMQDDGTAPGSCNFDDITNDVTGVASFTADDLLADSAGVLGCFKYVRFKVVASSGSNDADWTIYVKELY